MVSAPVCRKDSATNVVLLGALYVCELSALLLAMALYRLVDRPILSFLASRPGLLCLAGLPVLAVSSGVIVQQYRKGRWDRSRRFGLTVMLNIFTLLSLLTIAELAIRVFSFRTTEGLVFMHIP